MEKLKLGIIGQGRSGRGIHGNFLRGQGNDMFEVVAVSDLDPDRRARALEEYPGCRVYEDYRDLYRKEKLDVVVNAAFSDEHYPITKDLLLHKCNVLVEKPFARTYYECSEMMRIAEENGVVLAVFQQSFFAPFYTEMVKAIETGKIGEVKQVTLRYNFLGRRWDWQTLQYRVAGGLYNTGPHPVGIGLAFQDFDDNAKVVYSKLDSILHSGDSDDFAKVIITAPNKPTVDLEICNTDAYSDWNFKIQGTKGTYVGNYKGYKMKYIPDGVNPEQPLVEVPLKNEKGLPAYCSEKLEYCEEEMTFEGTAFDVGTAGIYRSLYNTITTGVPLVIPTEWAAKIIGIIETVHAQNPLPVKFLKK